jgi:hypothetical protein
MPGIDFVQTPAQSGRFRRVEVDRPVDQDDIGFQAVLLQQQQQTRQLAKIRFSARWFVHMGDAGRERSGSFARIPFVESHGSGQGSVAVIVNTSG